VADSLRHPQKPIDRTLGYMTPTERDRPHLLIVDDEPGIRNLLKSLLVDRYECTTADSAEAALGHLQSRKFDLVISDINMGGMTGLELVSHVRESSPDTVVMLVSGDQEIDSPIEALRKGAFDYLRKPFDIDQVTIAVDRAIAHGSLLFSKRRHEEQLEALVAERTQRLNYLAYHDTLSGLYNRAFFEVQLSDAIEAGPKDHELVLLFVSIDRFKGLRDTLGHTAASDLLRQVGKRLERQIGEDGIVARFDGDEFTVLVGQTDEARAHALAEQLLEKVQGPYSIGDYEIVVTASVGISRFPSDGTDTETLLRHATAALSEARKQGGNTCRFYSAEIHEAAVKKVALENHLRRALEREELELYYQPKIETSTREVFGMEALVRWNHPELGMISPLDFIPIAEETGLIIPVGEWILRTACVQAQIWNHSGRELQVAVNLSACQFQQRDLVESISEILRSSGLDARLLNLEVTESSIMNNTKAAVEILRSLRTMGIEISIDDFGTGHSSLGYLKHLPIDVLKIDKSFMDAVTENQDDATLVMAIISLAHTLRLKVVAEGVETEEQLRFLNLLRCDQWQGYLFSRPVPPDAFVKTLPQHSPGASVRQ
jgi:diguanylate cyclase